MLTEEELKCLSEIEEAIDKLGPLIHTLHMNEKLFKSVRPKDLKHIKETQRKLKELYFKIKK
jgi:hypothetical protein